MAVPSQPRLFRALLNDVTVTARGVGGSPVAWTATVTATGFRMRHGDKWTAVRDPTVTYTSGQATSVADGVTCVPGPRAANLRVPRRAFSCTGSSSLTAASVSWDATVTVLLPVGSLAGSYAGTIVHSVY